MARGHQERRCGVLGPLHEFGVHAPHPHPGDGRVRRLRRVWVCDTTVPSNFDRLLRIRSLVANTARCGDRCGPATLRLAPSPRQRVRGPCRLCGQHCRCGQRAGLGLHLAGWRVRAHCRAASRREPRAITWITSPFPGPGSRERSSTAVWFAGIWPAAQPSASSKSSKSGQAAISTPWFSGEASVHQLGACVSSASRPPASSAAATLASA
jgi:hypothetical protein